ncbi:MAG: bacterioferritin [Deltaproteobacteria bacterium]|nr:bacterioferritin [Deltaproteobacteria bacterium]
MNKKTFSVDVQDIRRRARGQLDQGAVTESYGADRATVIEMLNSALATELVCSLRYRRHYYMAQGIHSESVKEEFLEHANEELEHAGMLAGRIVQLGGEPDFNPDTLSERSHAEYVEGGDLVGMIEENLVAERIAIDSYRLMIQYIGAGDPTSRRILEQVLAVEEEHAEELVSLLRNLDSGEALRNVG